MEAFADGHFILRIEYAKKNKEHEDKKDRLSKLTKTRSVRGPALTADLFTQREIAEQKHCSEITQHSTFNPSKLATMVTYENYKALKNRKTIAKNTIRTYT